MSEAFTTEGLARFGEVAAAHAGDDRIPGLVALVARGEAVHVEAHGSLTIGGAPMRRDSQFRIASTTKPITAAATMVLVEEGLIDLDEPVGRLLPELATPRVLRRMDGPLDDTVPAEGPVTARQLLTFTAGFGMAVEMFESEEPWPVMAAAGELRLGTFGPPDPDGQPDPDTWIAALGSLPLIAQPGARWLYHTGASVLGVLLARAAGIPFAEVLRTRLFEPLGMASTSFWTADTSRLGATYRDTPEGPQEWDPPDGQWSRPPAFGDGAAGLLSTVDDLLAFARAMLAGGAGVLGNTAVTALTTPKVTDAQLEGAGAFLDGRSWAFGQAVETTGAHPGAYGWDGGLGSSYRVDPVHDLAVIVLTSRMWSSSGRPAVHVELEEAAYAALA